MNRDSSSHNPWPLEYPVPGMLKRGSSLNALHLSCFGISRLCELGLPVPRLLHSWNLGRQNVEMSRRLFLRDFAFREIRTQGVSLFLGVFGRRNVPVPYPLVFFCESRIWALRFWEIWLQGISLPLGTPGDRNAEMSKYQGPRLHKSSVLSLHSSSP